MRLSDDSRRDFQQSIRKKKTYCVKKLAKSILEAYETKNAKVA